MRSFKKVARNEQHFVQQGGNNFSIYTKKIINISKKNMGQSPAESEENSQKFTKLGK
jgi:hypothetical protein